MNEQNKNKNSSREETSKPDIQPSEPENSDSKTLNSNGDPGRTPGKAEGDLETVEEDLKDKKESGKS